MKSMLFRVIKILGIIIGLWLIGIFAYDGIMRWRVPVHIWGLVRVSGNASIAKASGTWTSDPEPQAFRIQTSQITCLKQTMTCEEATAQITSDRDLDVSQDSFNISAWEETRIVYGDATAECVQYIYTIDLITKSVTGVAKRKTDTTNPDCAVARTELRLTLKGGDDEMDAIRKNAEPWFTSLLAAPFKLF